MSIEETNAAPEPRPLPADLPEHLPPIKPPSAGFIVQLFVVPAIIVAVVIGLYLLFSRMASGEADWRQLVSDIRSDNPHVRWSSANQLATLLTDTAQRKSESAGPPLSENREIAQALIAPFRELTQKTTLADDEEIQLEFLGKAIGQLDVPDLVVPALLIGAEKPGDSEEARTLRKTSLNSLAMVVGRNRESGRSQSLPPALDDAVLAISEGADQLSRNQAAFILGLSGTPKALERLAAMLDDSDELIRVNAAVGLARNDSKQGLPVLEAVLKGSEKWDMSAPNSKDAEEVQRIDGKRFERAAMLRNALQAVQGLAPQMSPAERERAAADAGRIAKTFSMIDVQSVAMKTAEALQAP
jgi:hypothetical protein